VWGYLPLAEMQTPGLVPGVCASRDLRCRRSWSQSPGAGSFSPQSFMKPGVLRPNTL
jgi:hypothetical protein